MDKRDVEYYSTIRKKEILPFVTTWMALEGIILSEISQTEKDRYCTVLLMYGIQLKSQTLRNRELKVVARGWGKGQIGRGWKWVKTFSYKVNNF